MPNVFISYSPKDEVWKDKLVPQLKVLELAGMGMVVWQDRQIDAGEKWHPAIQDAMADAVAAVLLISADYLSSAFCVKEEVPYLLDRQECEGMLARTSHGSGTHRLPAHGRRIRQARCLGTDRRDADRGAFGRHHPLGRTRGPAAPP